MDKISVITVNLDNAEGLEATIQSVLAQVYCELEFLVIDGDSSDGSKDILKKYSAGIHFFVSEKDRGIYHAMNKGIAVASGDYILFLNSGDTFYSNTVLQSLMNEGNESDFIYGNLMIGDGKLSHERQYPSKLSFSYFLTASLPHPATLIKKALFYNTGLFFEHMTIAADWAFFIIAIAKHNCTYRHVPLIVSNFDPGGISSQEKYLTIIELERAEILQRFFPLFLDDYLKLDITIRALKSTQQQFGYRLFKKVKKLILKVNSNSSHDSSQPLING